MSVEYVLTRVPVVYGELETALTGAGSSAVDGERVSGGGDVHPSAPVQLDVAEHRHKLLRGLRWWCDAVDATSAPVPLGDSVARMCAWLLVNVPHMAPEDRAELLANLQEWLDAAWPMIGAVPSPAAPRIPVEALDRVVSQRVASEVLGVPVSTVWRRAGGRGGEVRLLDVAGPLCPTSDLPGQWCDHCRNTGA